MSNIARLLSILDLLTVSRPAISAEEVAAELNCSTPTAYRHLRELVESGMLQRSIGGEYRLGPRIITLDYHLRASDPLLKAARTIMDELAEHSGFDAVMSRWYGNALVDTHRATHDRTLDLHYGRGHPRPLFQGAAPKAILSTFPKAKLAALFKRYPAEIAASGLGESLESFRSNLLKIRRAGYYLSRGELETDMSAVGTPLFTDDTNEAVAALALVIPNHRFEFVNLDRMVEAIKDAAARISVKAKNSG